MISPLAALATEAAEPAGVGRHLITAALSGYRPVALLGRVLQQVRRGRVSREGRRLGRPAEPLVALTALAMPAAAGTTSVPLESSLRR